MGIDMSPQEFEALVGQAMDSVPDELFDLIDNCVLMIEPAPPQEMPGILGLYEGIPLPERNNEYFMVLPDRIFIFRDPILAMCRTREQVVHEVRITVIHEIAHHFGIDDERLHELGYG